MGAIRAFTELPATAGSGQAAEGSLTAEIVLTAKMK